MALKLYNICVTSKDLFSQCVTSKDLFSHSLECLSIFLTSELYKLSSISDYNYYDLNESEIEINESYDFEIHQNLKYDFEKKEKILSRNYLLSKINLMKDVEENYLNLIYII